MRAPQALGADAARRDLGFHVAHHEVRGPDVVAQHMPHRNHRPSLVVDLDRSELESFRVGVNGVDDAAAPRGQGTDVEVVRGGDRVAGQGFVDEYRHNEGDVGAMAGARVCIVVHESRRRDAAFRRARPAPSSSLVHTRGSDRTGAVSNWADSAKPRPLASTRPAPKSSDSRMMEEYDIRISL